MRPWMYWQSPERILIGLFISFLGLTAFIGYDYYKIYAWPTAGAVVDSIDWRCIYFKKRIFLPKLYEYLDCDAKAEAAKLTADGYRYKGASPEIWVVYQPEAGEKIRAVIDWWPPEAGWLPAVGSSIRLRYSPGAPDSVEFATKPGRKGLVIVIMILGLVGVSFVALPLIGQGEP